MGVHDDEDQKVHDLDVATPELSTETSNSTGIGKEDVSEILDRCFQQIGFGKYQWVRSTTQSQ